MSSSFLASIDWNAVEAGTMPPIDFDERLGFLDILNPSDHVDSSEISDSDQQLFAGF